MNFKAKGHLPLDGIPLVKYYEPDKSPTARTHQ